MRPILAAAALAAGAMSVAPAAAAPVDLLLRGAAANDGAGIAVARGGDVNGDGREDILVGAPQPRALPGCPGAGAVYVVFGRAGRRRLDLGRLGPHGFVVRGPAGAGLGTSVAGAGDVDGDGFDDFVVGAPHASPDGRTGAGAAFLVRGRRSTAPVDVSQSGEWGRRIAGADSHEGCAGTGNAGYRVAGLGDVNGDGAPDVAVGAPRTEFAGRMLAGALYVVYGGLSGRDVDLTRLGDDGFLVGGPHSSALLAASSRAGDIDGDGIGDVLIPVTNASPYSRQGAGSVFVLPGDRAGASIDLAASTRRGLSVDGARGGTVNPGEGWRGDALGSSTAALGDWNADGRGDLVLGRATGPPQVVFGRALEGEADLAIDGAGPVLAGATVVLGAADLVGDWRREVVAATRRGLAVYAPSGRRVVRTTRVRLRGVRPASTRRPESIVVAAGDRRREAWLLRGAPTLDPLGRPDAGSVTVERIRLARPRR